MNTGRQGRQRRRTSRFQTSNCFPPGTLVRALWLPNGSWYPGTIVDYDHKQGRFFIKYEDDDTRWLLPHQIRKLKKDAPLEVPDPDQQSQQSSSTKRQSPKPSPELDATLEVPDPDQQSQQSSFPSRQSVMPSPELDATLEVPDPDQQSQQSSFPSRQSVMPSPELNNDATVEVWDPDQQSQHSSSPSRQSVMPSPELDATLEVPDPDQQSQQSSFPSRQSLMPSPELDATLEVPDPDQQSQQSSFPSRQSVMPSPELDATLEVPDPDQQSSFPSRQSPKPSPELTLGGSFKDKEYPGSEGSSDSEEATDSEGSLYVPETEIETECEEYEPIKMASHRNIVVVQVTKDKNGKRRYDKKYYCYYCHKPISKIARHLKDMHSDESEVTEYLHESNPKKKQSKLTVLRNMGNYVHNREVIMNGKGEFIVTHRPSAESLYSGYDFCKFCYATLSTASVWKHSCPMGPSAAGGVQQSAKKKRIRKASRILKTYRIDMQNDMSDVLKGMRQDNVGKAAQGDELILRFGSHMMAKAGADKEQFTHIRGKMRQLGRLLLSVKDKDPACQNLSQCINPEKFSVVSDAARECAGYDASTHKYKNPSQSLRSGQHLKRAAEIKLAHALESGDRSAADESTNFIKLLEMRWSEVSSTALKNLNERRRNGVEFLPLTEDIVKMNQFLNSESKKYFSKLADDPLDEEAFFDLQQVVLSKIILFNRKRQGEVSKIKVCDWQKKRKAQPSEEVLSSLDEFEKKLTATLKRLEIRGKRGRTVPILITEEIENGVDAILRSRHHFIPDSNPYLFATGTEGSHMRGSDAMRQHALKCGAKKPHLLTSTKLRKSLATMSQILNLKENEMDQVADFLGHDIRVHRQFYRLPLDVTQVARISKVFIAANKGCIAKYSGKGLDDINVADTDIIEFDADGEEEEDKDEYDGMSGTEPEDGMVSDDEHDEDMPSTSCRVMPSKKKRCKLTSRQTDNIISDDEHDEEMLSTSSRVTSSKKKRRKLTKKKKWTEKEKRAVRKQFAAKIARKELPGKKEIEQFIKQYENCSYLEQC